MARAWVVPAIGGACFGLSLLLRFAWVDGAAEVLRLQVHGEDALRSPGRAALQAASLEHPLALADVTWLQMVQDLGRKESRNEAGHDRVQRWAHIAVDLDPRYYTVYWATAIHLIAYARRPDAVEPILEKARRFLPQHWDWTFYLGYVEYFIRGRPLVAADWWEKTVRLEDAPRFVPSLAARARFQAGDEGGAIAILQELERELPESPARADVRIRLKLLYSERDILRPYDEACARFRAEHGRVPAALELFQAGLVSREPRDLLGDEVVLDEGCRARTKEIRVREDEARRRIGMEAETATTTETQF